MKKGFLSIAALCIAFCFFLAGCSSADAGESSSQENTETVQQVGPIGRSLPRNDSQTTTQAGDIVLYSGNQIVVFYGSNAWAYTRLGHIRDKSAQEMAELLGYGDVTVTIGCY